MSEFRFAIGHDVALIDLDTIDPQPHSEGVKTTQRTYGTSGAVHERGPYTEWEWDVAETDAQYLDIITQLGLASALWAEVTIYTPNHNFVYARYNGIAVRPQVGQDVRRVNYFPRNIKILIKNLEAL